MTNSFQGVAAREIWESAPDAMLLVRQDGTILEANAEACRLFGYADGIVGKAVESLIPERHVSTHAGLRKNFHAGPRRRTMGAGARLEARRADGTSIPVHISLSPLDNEVVIAAIRDVTEVVAYEDRLVDSTRRRILAEDHERIAKNMHDTIIQELFALGMNMQAMIPALPEQSQASRVEAAVSTLDDVIHSIRALIFDIRNSSDDQDNLRVKVVDIASSLIPSLGFEPSVSFQGTVDAIPEALHEDIVAVTRESLTNIARHAEATAAAIQLSIIDGHVHIRVTDDGIGIEPEPERRSGHANLAERALLARGEFMVRARKDGGTTVEWTAPVA